MDRTILLGIGRILGSFVASLFSAPGRLHRRGEHGPWGWVLSILGAVVLVLIYRQARART